MRNERLAASTYRRIYCRYCKATTPPRWYKKQDCDTCKARHTRCDEGKPVCDNCKRLNLHCQQHDFIRHSHGPADEQRQRQRQRAAAKDAPSSANISSQQIQLPEAEEREYASSTQPMSTWDLFKTYPPPGAAEDRSTVLSPANSQPSGTSGPLTLTSEMVHLLKTYQTGVATWMDMFDYECTYQREVLRRCTTSKLLVNSVCAFTAKNLSLLPSGEVWANAAGQYYSKALQMLIGHIGNRAACQEDALTSTMLLSSYEMIASQEEAHKHHFYGARLLLTSRGVSASSAGVDLANFWIYIRHEIFVALVNEAPLQMGPASWNVSWREGETDEHMLGNQALWLVGRAINVLYWEGPTSDTRRDILADAARWKQGLPASFHGIKYGESDDQGFCKIYFALPAAAASMLLFHLLHLLLLAEPIVQDTGHIPQVNTPNPSCPSDSRSALTKKQIEYHATEIAIIGTSDICQCVRNFSVQAIFYAAKHITGVSKKLRLWNMLVDIEVRLGFSTRNRIKRLEQLLDGSA